jgi:hypothetical protein
VSEHDAATKAAAEALMSVAHVPSARRFEAAETILEAARPFIYPTAHAYEAACKALEIWKDHARRLEEILHADAGEGNIARLCFQAVNGWHKAEMDANRLRAENEHLQSALQEARQLAAERATPNG